MDIINGSGPLIAGATPGELIYVHLTTLKTEHVILNKVTRYGIEGFDNNLLNKPLTFFPFNNIIKVTRDQTNLG